MVDIYPNQKSYKKGIFWASKGFEIIRVIYYNSIDEVANFQFKLSQN